MTKTKSTKRALVSSALALMMCISMLIGSTFAWFTDSVTSSSNKIQSGTLKLDLEMLVKNDDNTTSWKSIKEDKTALFNYTNWEPGYTDVKVLKVENEGSLALKWVAKFVAEKELSALANVIDVYVCPSETEIGFPADRTLAGYTRVGTVAEFVNTIEETTNGTLEARKEAYLGIALKMQETAGNEYQGLDLGGAFDIQILATQYTFENDSFDNQYDKDAEYLVPVKSAKEFTNALAEGKDVELTDNIDLAGAGSAYTNDTTIDLKGNELTFSEGTQSDPAGFAVDEGAVISLVNTSTQRATLTVGANEVLQAGTGAVLNLENIDLTIEAGGTIMAMDGTINLKNCNVTVENDALFWVLFDGGFLTDLPSSLNIENSSITVKNKDGIICEGLHGEKSERIINFVSGSMTIVENCTGFTLNEGTTLNIGEAVTISCATGATEYTIPGNAVTVNDNR